MYVWIVAFCIYGLLDTPRPVVEETPLLTGIPVAPGATDALGRIDVEDSDDDKRTLRGISRSRNVGAYLVEKMAVRTLASLALTLGCLERL